MADTPLDQISADEKIAQAQEMLSIATRNYYVKAYADAVDDFSAVCSILAEVYGPTAEELGTPYLMYAKCLIALGQDENKLMDIPEEEENGDDDDDEGEDEDGEGGEVAEGKEEEADKEEKEEGDDKKEEGSKPESSSDAVDTAQPGSSTGVTKSEMDTADDNAEEDEDDVANLQVAWEVLELAVGIFSQIPSRAKELADSYIELAGISFENSNFEAAIKDFKQALGVLQDLPEKDNRELAEIHYKIGLAYTMLNLFEEGKIALMKACGYLDDVLRGEEAKEQSEDRDEVIKDLKETRAEIENKIAEVEDYKQQSMEEVKRELSKLVGHNDNFDQATGAGEGASSSKPAANISHLIKRKKPDEAANNGAAAGAAGEGPAINDITHLVKRKKE